MALPDVVGVAHWELTGGYIGEEEPGRGEVEEDDDGDVDPCSAYFMKDPAYFSRDGGSEDVEDGASEGAGPSPSDDLQAMAGSKRHYR